MVRAALACYVMGMTNTPDRNEWNLIHTDGDHKAVIADGESEDEFGYKIADCPLCAELNTETVIRDLSAYGDTLTPQMPALDLLLGFADLQLPTDRMAKVRTILEHEFDYVTDSLIEDLLEDMIDADDDFNE
jgi:hypothetical protein